MALSTSQMTVSQEFNADGFSRSVTATGRAATIDRFVALTVAPLIRIMQIKGGSVAGARHRIAGRPGNSSAPESWNRRSVFTDKPLGDTVQELYRFDVNLIASRRSAPSALLREPLLALATAGEACDHAEDDIHLCVPTVLAGLGSVQIETSLLSRDFSGSSQWPLGFFEPLSDRTSYGGDEPGLACPKSWRSGVSGTLETEPFPFALPGPLVRSGLRLASATRWAKMASLMRV